MRLFVALDIDDGLREELERLRPPLLRIPSLRLMDPEETHLTLKFLGEVPEEKLDKVKGALAAVPFSTVKLETTRLGAFPHVLWLGVRLTKALAQLQQDVARAVRPFTTHDPRSYRPHLTLARFQRLTGEERAAVDRLLSTRIVQKWKADRFTLYRSELTPQGPRYTALAAFPQAR